MFKIVPFNSEPNQTMTITLPIDNGNLVLELQCRYNTVANYWTVKATNPDTKEVYFDGLPLLYGVYPSANQLSQISYKRIGSMVLVKNGEVDMDMPNDINLGNEFLVLWGDTIG
jgi:hypothetical protein